MSSVSATYTGGLISGADDDEEHGYISFQTSCCSDTGTAFSEDYNADDAVENVDSQQNLLKNSLERAMRRSLSDDESDDSSLSGSGVIFDFDDGNDDAIDDNQVFGSGRLTGDIRIIDDRFKTLAIISDQEHHEDMTSANHHRKVPDSLALNSAQIGCDDDDSQTSANLASGGVNFFEDREFDFVKAGPVRRSTSLKTYKTPPGTPGPKKAVRFADALGLDLESVRHIMNTDEPPLVPSSAVRNLSLGATTAWSEWSWAAATASASRPHYWALCFAQPVASPDYLRRVADRRVSLENCVFVEDRIAVSGIVRVVNMAFEKCVVVRYTFNQWTSYRDAAALFVPHSSDGATDRFSFTFYLPTDLCVGSRVEFAVMYVVAGCTYWDSNFGTNYRLECRAR